MKISVVTTCFNAAGTLRDCLESVKEQTKMVHGLRFTVQGSRFEVKV